MILVSLLWPREDWFVNLLSLLVDISSNAVDLASSFLCSEVSQRSGVTEVHVWKLSSDSLGR